MAKLIRGVNDLATVYPEVAAEWDYEKNYPLRPEDFTKGAHIKVWWICKRGHSYLSYIYDRTCKNEKGCPYCSGRLPIKGENDLLTLRPDIAEEWDYEKNYPLRPENFIVSSRKKVWWICEREHSYLARIDSRTGNNNTGCPYCSGRLPIKGETDLLTLYPKIAAEWDYIKNAPHRPEDFTAHSNKKVWWICKRGHNYQATINHRTKKDNTGCPYCSGRLPIKGETDLLTLRPDIAAEWDYERNYPLRPENFSVGADVKVWWICKRGHNYQAYIFQRTGKKGTKCPYCAGKLPIKGKNDLLTSHPYICKDWDYDKNAYSPDEYTANSNKFVYWKCHKCGYAYRRRIYNQVISMGCEKCK